MSSDPVYPDPVDPDPVVVAPAPPPADPRPNKAVMPLAVALVTLVVQWADSGEFTLSQEGVTALAGVVASGLVWLASNWRKFPGIGTKAVRSDAGQVGPSTVISWLFALAVLVIVVWLILRLLD